MPPSNKHRPHSNARGIKGSIANIRLALIRCWVGRQYQLGGVASCPCVLHGRLKGASWTSPTGTPMAQKRCFDVSFKLKLLSVPVTPLASHIVTRIEEVREVNKRRPHLNAGLI